MWCNVQLQIQWEHHRFNFSTRGKCLSGTLFKEVDMNMFVRHITHLYFPLFVGRAGQPSALSVMQLWVSEFVFQDVTHPTFFKSSIDMLIHGTSGLVLNYIWLYLLADKIHDNSEKICSRAEPIPLKKYSPRQTRFTNLRGSAKALRIQPAY